MGKIRVLIVDDSAVVRQVLSELIGAADDMVVVATASDPIIAKTRLEKEWPDVIITDIEMPRMDGITFIEEIMHQRPTPIVVCSSHAGASASMSMRALAAGAVEVIEKPKVGVKDFLNESEMIIVDAVRSAAHVDVKRIASLSRITVEPKLSPDVVIAAGNSRVAAGDLHNTIVVLGASAGGTQAIERVLRGLPADCPPIAIVQHMPEYFTRAFAERLNTVCEPTIKEAESGDSMAPGHVFVAPGGRHMMLNCSREQYTLTIKDGPLVSRHRPSVDVLFRSAAKCAGKNAMGIILTGMGDDGAIGMKEMHDVGITTIAQNEETCAVFGMPKEAIRREAVDKILPLEQISSSIVSFYLSRGGAK